MHQKGFAPLLVLVVLAIGGLAIGVIYLGQQKSKTTISTQKDAQLTIVPKSSDAPKPTVPSTPVPSTTLFPMGRPEDMKTYSNIELGISFKYPDYLNVSDFYKTGGTGICINFSDKNDCLFNLSYVDNPQNLSVSNFRIDSKYGEGYGEEAEYAIIGPNFKSIEMSSAEEAYYAEVTGCTGTYCSQYIWSRKNKIFFFSTVKWPDVKSNVTPNPQNIKLKDQYPGQSKVFHQIFLTISFVD